MRSSWEESHVALQLSHLLVHWNVCIIWYPEIRKILHVQLFNSKFALKPQERRGTFVQPHQHAIPPLIEDSLRVCRAAQIRNSNVYKSDVKLTPEKCVRTSVTAMEAKSSFLLCCLRLCSLKVNLPKGGRLYCGLSCSFSITVNIFSSSLASTTTDWRKMLCKCCV